MFTSEFTFNFEDLVLCRHLDNEDVTAWSHLWSWIWTGIWFDCFSWLNLELKPQTIDMETKHDDRSSMFGLFFLALKKKNLKWHIRQLMVEWTRHGSLCLVCRSAKLQWATYSRSKVWLIHNHQEVRTVSWSASLCKTTANLSYSGDASEVVTLKLVKTQQQTYM